MKRASTKLTGQAAAGPLETRPVVLAAPAFGTVVQMRGRGQTLLAVGAEEADCAALLALRRAAVVSHCAAVLRLAELVAADAVEELGARRVLRRLALRAAEVRQAGAVVAWRRDHVGARPVVLARVRHAVHVRADHFAVNARVPTAAATTTHRYSHRSTPATLDVQPLGWTRLYDSNIACHDQNLYQNSAQITKQIFYEQNGWEQVNLSAYEVRTTS